MNYPKSKAKKIILLGLDGADPMIMGRFMDEGKLPNLGKVKEMGLTTEDMSMLGAMPTITPPNWASLSTGSWPGTHGITCFWNHTTGNSLLQLENGFNSSLSEAEFIWDAAARVGKKSIIFNYPTGWPPSNKENLIVVDGTGICVNTKGYVDFEKIYQCEEGDFSIKEIPHDADQSGANCMVEGEVETKKFDVNDADEKDDNLMSNTPGGGQVKILADERVGKKGAKYDLVITPIKPGTSWKNPVAGAKEVVLPVNSGQQRRLGFIIAEDGKTYNKLQIYASKQDDKPIGEVYAGQWSEWIYDTFKQKGQNLPVAYKVKIMSMEQDGSKMELYYSFALSLTSDKWFYPNSIGPELYEKVGPMMHMSNCGRDQIMLETQAQMYDWYAKALLYLTANKEWDLLYTHVHALDFCNHNYQDKLLEEHNPANYQYYLDLVLKYYEISDQFVGEMLQRVDAETLLFIVSDHGGVSKEYGCEIPLIGDPWSVGGKLLEEMGYLVVKRENGKVEADWEKTKAISQRSGYIYVNLKGREPHGSVEKEEYDSLVERIIDDLLSYRDPKNGRRPICFAFRKDEMKLLGLYGNHVGDIYFTFNPSWTRVHGTSLTTHSYKGTSVACLFMMAGPGVKKGSVIKRHVRIVDIVPTICYLSDIPVPRDAEGGIIYQAMEE